MKIYPGPVQLKRTTSTIKNTSVSINVLLGERSLRFHDYVQLIGGKSNTQSTIGILPASLGDLVIIHIMKKNA